MSSGDDITSSKPSDTITGAAPRKATKTGSKGMAIALIAVLILAGAGAGIYYYEKVYLPGTQGGKGGNNTNLPSFTISETGSSLIFPYMEVLGPNFTKLYPNIQISPQSTGSGTGISSAEKGLVDIGGTDAYLTPSTAANYSLINVPIAISAQLVYYNLPGVSQHLNLNGTVLAMIYAGAITKWNDPMIQAANPGVTLPSNTIIPLHRSDGSGDTFMFTSLLYMSWKGWTASYGTSITWKAGQPGYQGNSGMVTGLQNTPYGIAYIGISYESEANAANLQYAALGDQAANVNGTNAANYVLPTPATISQDANLALQNLAPPSVAISLILGGVPGAINLQLGKGGTLPTSQYPTPYPDTNLEYTLVSTNPSNPSKQLYVVKFLEWSLQSGGTYASQVNFLPLTAAVIGYDMEALNSVKVSGTSSSSYTISETGSSLIFPYMEVLGPNFTKLYPNIQISPQSTGSGTGISSAEKGLVDIGGTDAYLTPSTAANYSLINVPIAISAQLVYYNL
ncbi:MAG: phosphate ABC transporter substrate-binding protein PstS, partial [Candidatus Thermoplasmatota archaeon]|nr:phosphate ABC transporter substrate-binding protein PstS [Candidatus Thermoplasmatota archaeon]